MTTPVIQTYEAYREALECIEGAFDILTKDDLELVDLVAEYEEHWFEINHF